GASAAEVAVNVETGEVKVLRLGDCFDMGQPINPKLCEGQMDGGRAMGLGSTLSEEVSLWQGKIITPNYMDYKMPTAADLPGNAEAVSYLVSSTPHQDGPYGAKGFSEGVNVPQSPAIASAIYNAVGVRIKDIPITKEKVLRALRKR
ncbi:MAG: xanthine dehydrogenase, partial [Dehalococcoidia bacterium]|nr:xanthine dehydrogenase [Dehalococcoidia bacterium]